MKRNYLSVVLLVVTSMLFSINDRVFAVGSGGMTNQVAGARALGMANAFVAQSDDISAITFNPAGLSQIKDSEVSIGTTFQTSSTEYTSDNRITDETEDQLFITPNLHFYRPIYSKIGVGLGITVPFGLGTEWSKTSQTDVKFIATQSQLDLVNINPTISVEVNPQFSVGFGIDYFNSFNVEMGNRLDVAVLNTALGASDAAPEGDAVLDGDGDGWGFNFGFLFTPSSGHRVGLAYRSEIKVNYKGEVRLSGLSGEMADGFGTNYTNNITTDITFPQILTMGYAYNIRDNWTLEADIEWTGWSSFKEIDVNFSETNTDLLGILNDGNPSPREWDDVFSFAIGTEYILDNDIALRCGYFFFDTPVPDKTFEPSIPDADIHGIALGAGYPFRSFIVDLGYQGLFVRDRNVDNEVGDSIGHPVDGRYESMLHYAGLNLTYRF